MAENTYDIPDQANALDLWGVLQVHCVMAEFVRTNFREHPMFHPSKMIMFLSETSFPKSEIDRVSGLCSNMCGIPSQVDTILQGLNSVKSRMDTVEDRLLVLEQAGGFGGPGGGDSGQAVAANRKADQKRKRVTAPASGGNDDIVGCP